MVKSGYREWWMMTRNNEEVLVDFQRFVDSRDNGDDDWSAIKSE
jgi:hypothetical protein